MSGSEREVWVCCWVHIPTTTCNYETYSSLVWQQKHVVSTSSILALHFKILDELVVWHWGFWFCWTFWLFFFPCWSALCFSNDWLSLLLNLGCVLRMVFSCLLVCEQVFLKGLLWSMQFSLEVSPSVFLCMCQYASSSFPLSSFTKEI